MDSQFFRLDQSRHTDTKSASRGLTIHLFSSGAPTNSNSDSDTYSEGPQPAQLVVRVFPRNPGMKLSNGGLFHFFLLSTEKNRDNSSGRTAYVIRKNING